MNWTMRLIYHCMLSYRNGFSVRFDGLKLSLYDSDTVLARYRIVDEKWAYAID